MSDDKYGKLCAKIQELLDESNTALKTELDNRIIYRHQGEAQTLDKLKDFSKQLSEPEPEPGQEPDSPDDRY